MDWWHYWCDNLVWKNRYTDCAVYFVVRNLILLTARSAICIAIRWDIDCPGQCCAVPMESSWRTVALCVFTMAFV